MSQDPSEGPAPSVAEVLESLAKSVVAGGPGRDVAWHRLAAVLLPWLAKVLRAHFRPPLSERVEIEDVMQEVLIAVNQGLVRFEFRGSIPFLTWVRRLAASKMTDMHRHHTTEGREAPAGEIPINGHAHGVLEVEDRRAMKPAERASSNDDVAAMMSMIARLPESQAEAIRMMHLDLATLEQAARTMDVSESTVRYHLKRGEATLARWLRRLAS